MKNSKPKNVVTLPKKKPEQPSPYLQTLSLRLRLDEADIEELRGQAEREGLTLSELVAEIVHLWL